MKEYLTCKELAPERDRLRALYEVTNALVSKPAPDVLSAALSGQPDRIIPHSTPSIALYDQEASELQLHLLQMRGENRSADIPKRRPVAGIPLEETTFARCAVVIDNIDLGEMVGQSPALQGQSRQIQEGQQTTKSTNNARTFCVSHTFRGSNSRQTGEENHGKAS